jgi:hypothetical protein
MSEEHHMGPSMSVCRSRFSGESGNPHGQRVIVPFVVINIPIIILIPIVILISVVIFNPVVILISVIILIVFIPIVILIYIAIFIPIVILIPAVTIIPIVIVIVIVIACSPLALPPLALYLPGWTPLGFYHLRLDHPGLRRPWTAPEGLHHPQG